MSYVPGHVHTDYSNSNMKDSVNTIDNTLIRLKEIGATSWAITDHGTTSGVAEAYKKSKKAGIKLIPGMEGYLTADLSIQQRDLSHITFWAKNAEGLHNLYRLSTIAGGDKGKSPNNFYFKPRLDINTIRRHSKGIMLGSACLGGFINKPHGEENLMQLLDIFGDDLFLEIHTYQCPEQFEYNHRLIELSEKHNIKIIVATDAHFTWKHDADLRRAFQNTSKTQEGDEHIDDTLYLQSDDEIRGYLSYLPSEIVETAIANTQIISDRSNVEIAFGGKNYPHFPCNDPYETVHQKCVDAWNNDIKGSGVDLKVYADRFKKELEVSKTQDYCGYYLITGDYLDFAKSKGIPTGPGRGSAVASLVVKSCGITKLDPISLNLTFERFAHNERSAPPDIDCDVSTKGRGEIIEYLRSRYGEVHPVRTFQTMAESGACRMAGRSLKWDNELVDSIAKSLTKYESDDEDDHTSKHDQKIWALNNIRTDENAELIDLAKRFVGIITGYSKHASAVLIVDEDIERFCAVEKQNDSKTKMPCYLAACSYPLLEAMGLMKCDILGLKTLDVLAGCTKLCKDLLGIDIDIDKIPLDDITTSEMLCAGRTAGCFQVEGHGITQLVKEIRPRSFEDLIPLVALYRPGPLNARVEETGNTMVETYVRVKNYTELQQWIKEGHESESWIHWTENGGSVTPKEIVEPTYLHDKLRPILGDTYSIILYQEQILEIAKSLCGYTLGEADNLRRIIGKKKIDEMQPAIDAMIQRGINNNIPQDVMKKVTTQIVEFASYCFNRGHSAAYGLLSYQTAYLKANYPVEYMCSVINSEDCNHKDILPYIKECGKLDIDVLAPDLTKLNREWVIEDGVLRIGLHYVKGIGNNLSLEFIDSYENIVSHNAKDVTTALIKSGAMDFLGESRQQMLSKLTSTQERIARMKKCKAKIEENQVSLELSTDDKATKKYTRQLNDWKGKLLAAQTAESEASTEHYDETIGEYEVLGYSNGIAPNIKVGKVINIYSKIINNGTTMAWITMKTDYGEYRCAVFSDVWDTIHDLVLAGSTYKFIAKTTDRGCNLEEICIDGVTYKKPKKKSWPKR